MGRYLFTPAIFDKLEKLEPGVGGEIQLTDAIAGLLDDEPVYGYVFSEGRFDIGKKIDYLRATVELALRATTCATTSWRSCATWQAEKTSAEPRSPA